MEHHKFHCCLKRFWVPHLWPGWKGLGATWDGGRSTWNEILLRALPTQTILGFCERAEIPKKSPNQLHASTQFPLILVLQVKSAAFLVPSNLRRDFLHDSESNDVK